MSAPNDGAQVELSAADHAKCEEVRRVPFVKPPGNAGQVVAPHNSPRMELPEAKQGQRDGCDPADNGQTQAHQTVVLGGHRIWLTMLHRGPDARSAVDVHGRCLMTRAV